MGKRVAHAAHPLHGLGYAGEHVAPQRRVRAQRVQPARQVDAQLGDGELIERQLEYLVDVLRRQVQAVDAHTGHAVLVCQLRAQLLRRLARGVCAVEHQHEGLAYLAQLAHHALLGGDVALALYAADAAVRGHDDADGAVVGYDAARALLGRAGHGHLLVEPGRGHHALGAVLELPGRAVDHVAHAVYQPHGEAHAAVERDVHRVLRVELRLRGHDGAAGAGLRQFVLGALPGVDVLDVRYDQRLHEALYERALAGAHGSHQTQVDVAAGTGGNVMIYRSVLHVRPLFPWSSCFTI